MNDTYDFTVTDRAWLHIEKFVPTTYLLIGLKVSGCSGYAYDLQPVDERPKHAHSVICSSKSSVRILLDTQKAQGCFQGVVLDLKESEFGSQLFFENPNIEESCGCGQSFVLKEVNLEKSKDGA